MKILIHGLLTPGQGSRQRADALARLDGVEVIHSDLQPVRHPLTLGLASRVLRRLFKRPLDLLGENRQLLELARRHRPDIVLVENRAIIRASTLRTIRAETGAVLVYFCPDDVMSPVVLTRWLERTFPLWDAFFTTKTFNVEELRRAGSPNPIHVNHAFDPDEHRPLTPQEAGPDFERFDLVFVGQYEPQRAESLGKAAAAGLSVVVYGPDAGLLAGRWSRLEGSGIELRPAVWGEGYVRALHHGKVVLGFLRKINRDLITQRSTEVPAMGRVMLAEKTVEHDAHLEDGSEYVGFTSDEDMIAKARELIADPERRRAIGEAARRRCFESGYDFDTLARRMRDEFDRLLAGRG